METKLTALLGRAYRAMKGYVFPEKNSGKPEPEQESEYPGFGSVGEKVDKVEKLMLISEADTKPKESYGEIVSRHARDAKKPMRELVSEYQDLSERTRGFRPSFELTRGYAYLVLMGGEKKALRKKQLSDMIQELKEEQ